MASPDPPTRSAIARAAAAIQHDIRRTPVVNIGARDLDPGVAPGLLTLKLELLQHSGSFKVRGAFTNLAFRRVPPGGVVAASGGNHGAAVAFAARRFGCKATIFVPRTASPAKTGRIRAYGAELVVAGDSYDDALRASETWASAGDALPIHAFEQAETILGQATLGLELEEQASDVDTVLIAVGGGGLIAGVAAWYAGTVRIVGVEPVAAPTLTRAIAAGRPVDAESGGIAADSLAPRRVGELAFGILQPLLDRVVLVHDDDIRAAQRILWDELRIVAEPGGAAAFAGLISGAYQPEREERVAVIICGGNTTAVDFTH